MLEQRRPEGAAQKWFPRMRTDQPVPGPTAEQVGDGGDDLTERALREIIADLRQSLDAAEQERVVILAALGEPCAECGHVDWRSDGASDYYSRVEAAEAEVARLTEAFVALYKIDTKSAVHVADVCDTIIDPSGAFLGRVRDAALSPIEEEKA